MKFHYHTAALAALLAAGTAFSATAADLSEARVKELIAEYIKENPKAIIESLQNFQVQEEVKRIEEQAGAVRELGKEFDDPKKYPTVGNKNGDVRVVEFYDYNCPACKMMFKSIDQLLEEDKNVKVVFVEFPIFGPTSDAIAKIALAVHKLYDDKYYAFHKKLMTNEGKIGVSDVLNIASELGMDSAKLEAEYKKDEYNKIIDDHKTLARNLQIQGTPAVIVGDRMTNSALPLERLKNEVDIVRNGDTE
jgi:protein-disulfide isomerase